MAKLTLLEMTQKILSAMDSDEVDTITDTEEAQQVVDIIEDTYYELMSQKDWNHLREPTQLEELSDTLYPTTLRIPDEVVDIEDLRYEIRDSVSEDLEYVSMTYMDPISFTDYILSRRSTDSNIETLTVKGASTPLLVKNDKSPEYWTSYDEEYIVLDSYDAAVDTTLQASKSLVYCTKIPTFDKTLGTYVPDCPVNMFPTLLAEAKRACFFYLKQTDSPIDAKRSLRGMHRIKNKDYRAHERKKYPRFGRK